MIPNVHAYLGMCSNGKCTQSLEAGQDDIYTVPEKINYIVAKGYNCLIKYTSCTKQCKNWWPVISRMKHWGVFPTSISNSLHTREVQRNRNATHDYTYTGSSGKHEVTVEIS
jgi:hypothetical protein